MDAKKVKINQIASDNYARDLHRISLSTTVAWKTDVNSIYQGALKSIFDTRMIACIDAWAFSARNAMRELMSNAA